MRILIFVFIVSLTGCAFNGQVITTEIQANTFNGLNSRTESIGVAEKSTTDNNYGLGASRTTKN